MIKHPKLVTYKRRLSSLSKTFSLLQVLWRGVSGSSVCPSTVDHTPAEAHPVIGIQGQKVSPCGSSGSPSTCPTSSRLIRHLSLELKVAVVLKLWCYLCRRRTCRTKSRVPYLGNRGRCRATYTSNQGFNKLLFICIALMNKLYNLYIKRSLNEHLL